MFGPTDTWDTLTPEQQNDIIEGDQVTEEARIAGLVFTLAADIENSGWLPAHPSDQVNANNAIGIAEYLIEQGYHKVGS